MDLVKKMPLYVGKKCNAECRFCYYLSEIHSENISFEAILQALELYKKNGIKSLDITGGEPTIHKDIIKIVETAVQMGFVDIAVISNGITLQNEDFVKKLVKAGVSTFVLSIHGHTAEIHDQMSGRKGSFDALMKAMDIMNRNYIPFAVNTVVTVNNCQHLIQYAELLVQYNAKNGITFLVLNPLRDGKINFNSMAPKYSDITTSIKQAILFLEKKGLFSNWKFMPLCVAKDMLQYTANILQFYYKPYDWNYKVHVLFESGYWKYIEVLFKNFAKLDMIQLTHIPFKHLKYLAVLQRNIFYAQIVKIEECKACKYYYVCDGVNDNYISVYGKDEIKAVPGKKIINPLQVLGNIQKVSIADVFLNTSFYFLSKIVSLFLSKNID